MKKELILELKDIEKSFPGVKALNKVSLNLKNGEILGLVGQNGAGKSTLVKIIVGEYLQDKGTIKIKGQKIRMNNPYNARMIHKIAYVSQENTLCPDLTVAENILLGKWETKFGNTIDWKLTESKAINLLKEVGLKVNPGEKVRNLEAVDRQLVEIARALSIDVDILLMDEPTSWLSEIEKTYLFDRMRRLKKNGVGIIFISHFIDEVLGICDCIQVLRDGENIGAFAKNDINKIDLIRHMIGEKKEFIGKSQKNFKHKEKGILKIRNISMGNKLKNISFEVFKGEIFGITGLFGSGKTELARLIFGLEKPDQGEILIDGKEQRFIDTKRSIDLGLGFVTEDRKKEGIIPFISMAQNISLANFKCIINNFFVIRLKKENKLAKKYINLLDINPKDPEKYLINLSGGNQQKVVIAKWLNLNCKVLVLDEPTRGIDIGAKYEIYNILKEQANSGKTIIFISSELDEILKVTHRYIVLKRGKIIGEYIHGEISNEKELLSIVST